MSARNAAPSDLKDPEVTKQNLPKEEKWEENECVSRFADIFAKVVADTA